MPRMICTEELVGKTQTIDSNEIQNYLLKSAWKLGFAGDIAEDLVQETWLVYLSSPEKFRGASSLKTFLYGILQNKSRETWRRNKRRKYQEIEEKDLIGRSPEMDYLGKESWAIFSEAFGKLKEKHQEAFYLRDIMGEEKDAILNSCSLNDQNLRTSISRSKKFIANEMERLMA